MDTLVKGILKEWDLLERLESVFTEQEIDLEVFNSLTEKDVTELIPIVGLRRKFLMKYNIYRSAQEELRNSSLIILNNSTEDNTIFNQSSTTFTDEYISILSTSDTPKEDTDAENQQNLHPLSIYNQKATPDFPHRAQNSPLIISTVKNLLEHTDEGRIITASYGKGKFFLRSKLSELIIRNELGDDKNKRIPTSRFIALAQEINEIFVHERPETYYVPYIRGVNGRPKAARGKLWNTYTYLRSNYKKLGLITTASNDESLNVSEDSGTQYKEQHQWLKNNNEPFTKIQEYWKITRLTRLNEFTGSIHDYLFKYPCLQHPLGYTLLEEDFLEVFKGKENTFFSVWPDISKNILKIATKKQDPFLKETIESYTKSEIKSDATDEIFTLLILPLLFSCVNIKRRKGRNTWKPSKIEMKDGFILHIKIIDELETALAIRDKKYSSLGLTAQPIPVIVGELDKIHSCYVCINSIRYKVGSPLKAVDLCFKVYHALNATYPEEVDVVWMFIQQGVFQIRTKHDRKYIMVTSLLSDIENML